MSDNSSENHGSDIEFSDQANIEEEEPFEEEFLNEEIQSEPPPADSAVEIQQVMLFFAKGLVLSVRTKS